jgi:hypothetical protein
MFSQKTFQQLLYKKGEGRASWEYPFAVAGVNITFMLIQMLNLGSGNKEYSKPYEKRCIDF